MRHWLVMGIAAFVGRGGMLVDVEVCASCKDRAWLEARSQHYSSLESICIGGNSREMHDITYCLVKASLVTTHCDVFWPFCFCSLVQGVEFVWLFHYNHETLFETANLIWKGTSVGSRYIHLLKFTIHVTPLGDLWKACFISGCLYIPTLVHGTFS